MLARHVLQNYLKYQNPNNITQKDINMTQYKDYYVVTKIVSNKSQDNYSLMPIYTHILPPDSEITVSSKRKKIKIPAGAFCIDNPVHGPDFHKGSIVQLVKNKIKAPVYKESYEEFVVLSSEKILCPSDNEFYTNVQMFGPKSGTQFSQIHESSPMFDKIKRGDTVVVDTDDVDYPIIRNLTIENMISNLITRCKR